MVGDLDSPIVRSAAEQWAIVRAQPHTRDRSSLAGRVALVEDVVLMPDMLADPDYTYPLPAGTRAGLGVPIVLDGALIGTMVIVRDVSSPFTDDDVELIGTFADQAAVAVKNARLVEALQRQLDQQRAIGEVLRAIARSEGLQTVLDEIVETVTILCGGDNVRMWLVRDEVLHAVANGGWTDGWEYDQAHPHHLDHDSLSGRAALTREPVHVPDVTVDPDYVYEGPVSFRANLSVPILLDGEPIGVFGIVRREPEPFTDEVIDLVKTFADQAAIAIANARLIDAIEQQLEEQRAVSDTLRAVAEGGGLQPVLDAIVDAAKRLCHGEHAQLYLLEGDVLRIVSQTSDLHEAYDYAREHPHLLDRSTIVGRVALSREAEQITDVLEDPDYTYEGQRMIGFRALLGVPIAKEGELIGAIAVARDVPGSFAEDLVELVKTFADEAAVAIADARLIAAIETQLGQQRAVGDILAAVARSEGLEQVFDVVADAATRLCHGDYGAVYLKEGDVLAVVAQRYRQPDVHAYEKENPHPIDRHTAIGRAAVTGEVVHIPDTQLDPEYSWGASKIMEYRGLLAAPILLDGELIGALNVVRVEPEPFADEHIQLMKTFADQAAIAIANARLIDSVRRQLDQQRAISDVLGAVARAEGLDSVLHALVEAACRLCAAQFGEVYLVEGDALRLAVGHGGPPDLYEYEREHPQPIAGDRRSVNGRVLLTQDVVHIPDILEDEEYSWSAANEAGVRALLGSPLLVEGHLAGVFNIVRTAPEPFSDDQIELLRTFADQAAIAVANARLMEAVERQRAELSRFVSPQVAELVSSDEGQKMLAGHRAYVTSMFCDLRGFTSFTELAEPEELFEVLREYHLALGELIPRYEGTLEHFAGDGLMVFFNDPVPVNEHELKSVQLALAAQERFEELAATWRRRGHELGLGIGIAAGYATLGRIGFEGRYDYGVLGTVTNLASRLSTQAAPGQTLISQRVFAAVEERVEAAEVGALELKGFGRPVPAYEIRRLKS